MPTPSANELRLELFAATFGFLLLGYGNGLIELPMCFSFLLITDFCGESKILLDSGRFFLLLPALELIYWFW